MSHPDLFAQRRQKLRANLPPNTVACVPAAPVAYRNHDVAYRYRQDSHFLYLTGFHEPGAIMVLSNIPQQPDTVLFCQPYDARKAQWEGPMLGVAQASAQLGIATCASIETFGETLQTFVDHADHLMLPQPDHPKHHWWHMHQPTTSQTWQPLDDLLAAQRLIKSAEEIQHMQVAIDATIVAHRAVMQAVRPGITERHLYGVFMQALLAQGLTEEAYGAIVATGEHACILHYTAMHGTCEAGDMLLLDAGAEHLGYAADLTRTMPVNGQFTSQQRALYQHVLTIQTQAIASLSTNISWHDLNTLTQQWYHEALCDLGILTPQDKQRVADYAPHGLGHWLGLDVHDVGFCASQSRHDPLPEGCVLTIEPGLYIPHDDATVLPEWRGMGVRIEDDIWLHQGQACVLSAALEKTPDAIEAWMQA